MMAMMMYCTYLRGLLRNSHNRRPSTKQQEREIARTADTKSSRDNKLALVTLSTHLSAYIHRTGSKFNSRSRRAKDIVKL